MSPLDSNKTRFSFHHLNYHHHIHRWQSSCQPRPIHGWSIHQTMHSQFERGQLHALVRFVVLALHSLHYFPNQTYRFYVCFFGEFWPWPPCFFMQHNFPIIMHPLQKKKIVQHALTIQLIELKYGSIVQNWLM